MKIKKPPSKQPTPKDAKKVFSGVMFDVYQWQQEMFDGSYKTFEKIKRQDSVGVFPITKERKIILTRQSQPGIEPFIGVIGGRVENDKDPIEIAKEELLEEAGMKAKSLEFWYSEQLFEKIDWAIYMFIAKDLVKVQDPKPDSGEKIELVEYTFDELINLMSQDNFRDVDIAIKFLRERNDSKKFNEIKKLFSL